MPNDLLSFVLCDDCGQEYSRQRPSHLARWGRIALLLLSVLLIGAGFFMILVALQEELNWWPLVLGGCLVSAGLTLLLKGPGRADLCPPCAEEAAERNRRCRLARAGPAGLLLAAVPCALVTAIVMGGAAVARQDELVHDLSWLRPNQGALGDLLRPEWLMGMLLFALALSVLAALGPGLYSGSLRSLLSLAGTIFLGTGSAILALAVGGDRPHCTTIQGFLTFGAGLGAGLGLGLGLIRGRLSALVGGLLAGQAAGLLGFAVSFLFLKSPLTRAHPAEMPFACIVDFLRYFRFNVCAVGFGLTTLLTLLGLGLVELAAERLGSREAPPPQAPPEAPGT